jgi:hypothetical protein
MYGICGYQHIAYRARNIAQLDTLSFNTFIDILIINIFELVL